MGIFHRSAVALAAGFSMCAAAQAAGPAPSGVEASLSWQLGFGGQSIASSYSMALGYRPAEAAAPHPRLLALDVDGREASATLAGLPLYARSYQANQAGDSAEATMRSGERPWYTRSWVYWTVGGLATTAALAGSASSSGGNGSDGHHATIETNNHRICAVNSGGNVGPQQTPDACVSPPAENTGCAGDTCVYCADGNVASTCGGYAARRADPRGERDIRDESWLDAGTGRMGDLLPVAR